MTDEQLDGWFAKFWDAYPRKVSKRKAEEEFRRAVRRSGLDVVRSGFHRWRSHWLNERTGVQFIPYAQTWLHQARYLDRPDTGERLAARDVAPAGGDEGFKLWTDPS